MSYFKQVELISGSNAVATQLTSDGVHHLGTAIVQHVVEDTNNSSTTNLTSGNSYTFTGTATSTLGVVGLQWALKTDQNATVYVEESNDESNWDISYSYDYIAAKGGRGDTVQASMAYWRIRVVLTVSVDTTYFRLSGVLCPIATPLPSSLSPDGRLLSEATITGKENTDRHVWVSPTNALSVNSNVRLVGTNFDGTTKDPNFWTETVANAASVVQTGEIKLLTGSTANGEAQYDSVRRARFVVGSALQFTGAYKFNGTVAEADNVRRCGAYDDDEGFYFQLDGSIFSVGSRKEASDTLINSGSFNGNMGLAFTPIADRYYKLDIEWSPLGAFYYVNGVLLHKSVGGHLTRRLTVPIRFENINDNGNDTEVVFDCLGVVIVREGDLETNPTYKHISTATTTVCKYGAGVLHKVCVNDPTNAAITIYDNNSAAAPIMAIIDPDNGATPFEMGYNAPFSNGLTVVTAGTPDITVIYE